MEERRNTRINATPKPFSGQRKQDDPPEKSTKPLHYREIITTKEEVQTRRWMKVNDFKINSNIKEIEKAFEKLIIIILDIKTKLEEGIKIIIFQTVTKVYMILQYYLKMHKVTTTEQGRQITPISMHEKEINTQIRWQILPQTKANSSQTTPTTTEGKETTSSQHTDEQNKEKAIRQKGANKHKHTLSEVEAALKNYTRVLEAPPLLP